MGLEKLFDLVLQFIGLFKFWEVVDEYERGILLRLGRFRKVVGPGLRFRLPFYIDSILTTNVVFKTTNVRAQTLTTGDGETVVVSTVVSYSIADIKRFLLEVDSASEALRDSVYGTIGEFVRNSTIKEMLSGSWHDTLHNRIASLGRRFGIEVLSVRLSDVGRILTIRLINSQDQETKE